MRHGLEARATPSGSTFLSRLTPAARLLKELLPAMIAAKVIRLPIDRR